MNAVCSFIGKGTLNKPCRVHLDKNYCQFDAGKWACMVSSVTIKKLPGHQIDCAFQINSNQVRGHYSVSNTSMNLPSPLCMFNCAQSETENFYKQFPVVWFELNNLTQPHIDFNVRDVDFPESQLPLQNEFYIFFVLKRLD